MDRKARALRRQRLAAQATLALLVIALAPLAWAHAQSAPTPAAPSGITEVPELRTATSKTFKHPDGRLTKRLFAEPVHYREGGRWKDIDSSLVPTAPAERGQGYTWRTKSNGFGVLLKPRLEPDYMRFDISRQSFSFGLTGARPVTARTDGPRVEYPDALPGVDLRYEMRPEGVKEELVLRDANAPSKLHFTIDAPERLRTAATRRDDGSVELFAGGRGKPSFVLTPPFATDAAKGRKRADASTRRLSRDAAGHVSMSVDQAGGRYEVELAVDEDWLRDPKRRFPVTVDPSITIQPTAKSAEFTATCPGCSGYDWGSVDLGTDDIDAYRGAFQFDLSDVPPGAAVSSASLGLYNQADWCVWTTFDACGAKSHQLNVHRITSSWTVNTLTRNLLFDATPLTSYTLPTGAGDQWMTWGVTPTVQAWLNGTQPNYGLMVKRATEPLDVGGPEVPGGTWVDGDPGLRPRLDVTYTADAVRFFKPETLHGNGADLRWSRFDGSTGSAFVSYEVHRSATAGFTPSASTRVATITDVATTSFRDTTAAPSKAFSYKIVTNGKPSIEQRVTLPANGQASKTLQPNGTGTATTIDDFDGPATCANYGGDGWLYVGSDWYRERSLLDFDLRDIPSGASITAATLSAWMDEPPTASMTVGAYRATSNWDEGTSAWGDCTGDGASWAERTGSVAWDAPGGDYASPPVATKAHTASDAPGWDTFDIRAAVQTWASGGAPNQGILLRATDETDREGKWLSYFSDDYGANPARLPKLAITYADGSKVITPTVAITAPTGADTLHGTLSLEATASDDRRVDSVEFLVDGVSKGTDTTAPFAYSWPTTTASNGAHTVTARATDDAGNVTTSSARTVQVGNSAAPTTRVTYPSGAYQDVIKSDGPSAHWRLGETTGTTAADASGNARTATYAGAATLNQPSLLTGNADPAVKLASGGTVTATSLAGLLAGSLTAEAWVSTTGGNQRVVSRGWGAAGGWQLALTRDTAGVQRAEFAIDRGTSGIARASALVTAGKLHLAGTFDGTTARLYVNGSEAASAGASGATLTTTASVIVGGVLDAALAVDEVALFARAVPADHLRVHSDSGSGKPATVQGEGTVVEAAAADDGTVKRVEFYADGNRFAEDSSAPYTGTLPTLAGDTPLYDGTHDITTKAYDDHDLVTASATTKIAVANTANTIYQAGFNATAAPQAVTYTPSAATQQKSGFDITVTNTSQQTWSATNVVLRPRWIPPDPSATPIPGTEVSLGASLPPGQAKQVQVLVEPPALPVGVDKAQYTLQVDAVDKTTGKAFADKGNKPVENPVIVNKAIETGLGLEKFYQYDGEELGAGMNQLVNVASGNSIVRWTPLSSPGRGLSTVLDLTYNSLEKKSESPVGNNFSLSISGLSRFGNPIDIHPNKADEIGGRANKFVDVTDGDGTTHHFEGRQAADGSTYWVEPAGVHLYLRSLGTADPARRWAFTRPDRVTFYFDADGYPTSIEDANGNRITYTLEDTPPGEDPGGPKRRITRVTDAGGRSYDLAYYSKADAKKPHIRGKVRRITDHTGSALDFEYYEDGNLLRLIQRGGPNPDGTLLADRTFVFTYTTPNGDAPALSAAERVNPDPHTPSQSTRLFSVRDPRGRETTFAYLGTGNGDDRWKLASRTDRGGVTTSFAYDTLNRVTTVNAPLARVSKYAYDTEGKVTRITNPENQSTDVAWTADRMVASVTEPNGKATRYAYNANGYLTTETDQLDRVTRLVYEDLAVDTADVAGKWGAGRTVPHLSQLKTKTTPRGKVWTFAYDPRGNLTSVKDPENAETKHAYDPVNGNLTLTTDPNGNAQQFLDYDANGLVGRAVDAENRTTRFEHDADGLLLSVQDPLHAGDTGANPREYKLVYDYDAFERMVRQSRPKSTRFDRGKLIWSSAEFDPNDNVVRSLGAHFGAQYAPALSSVAERSYDPMDQLTEAIRPHAQGAAADTLERTQIAYDAAGRRQSVTSPRGVATTTDARDFAVFYDYDKLDRVIRSTREGDPGDATRQVRTTHFCFDQVGDLRSVTAPRAGLATVTCGTAGAPALTPYTNRIDYTFAHEATVRTDPNGNKTELGYDLDGNVRTIKDEQGSTTTRSYNGRDQVIEVVQPFDATRSVTSRFEYDPAGNLKKGVSPRAVSKGTTVDYVVGYEYDKVNRLTRTVLPKDANTPQAYEYRRYDANGNLTLTTLPTTAADLTGVDEADKTKMEYFDPGWIYWSDDQNPRLEYDYRAEGWQTKRTPSDKKGDRRDDRADTVSYFEDGTRQTEFDRAGRPTDYRYDLNNNLVYALDKDVDGGGNQKPLQSDMTYDGFDELATSKLTAEGKPTREGTFVYDANGNIRIRTDDKQGGDKPQDPRKHVFTYDPADQLTLHEDFGRKASDASDDRRITTSYKPTGWKDVRTVLENRSGSFAKKQEMRWDYFLNGRTRTQNTQAYDKAGTQSQSESHVLEYFNDVEYVNGHRVKDTFTRKSPKAAAKCQDSPCTATYVYDGRDRLTKETNTKGDGKSIDYTLDTAGNVDKQTGGPQGTVERDHSGGQQLWETVNGGPKTYSHYDDFGNLDCLTSTEPDSCAQAQSADHGPVLADYQYDPHDALQAFDDFTGHKSVDYTMDAFDRPVEERTEQSGDVKSKAMNYIGLSQQVSDEDSYKGSVASGTLEKSRAYSYGPDGDREAMTYKKAGGTEKNYSYGYDAQGSVSQLLDDDGKAQASYGYTAYGEPQDEMTQENDPDSTTGGTVDQSKDALNPYRYTGKRFNPATKQLDMGARTFAPSAQSFLQSDRYAGALDDMSLSTDPLTANRYSLAAGNPVSFVEVDGHWPDFVDDAVDSAGDALSDAGDAVSNAAGDAWDASKDVGKAAFEAGKFVVGDDPLEIGINVALTVGTGGTGLLVRTAAKAAIKGAVKAGGKKLLTKGVSALSKGAGAARSSAGASSARGAMAARGEASSLRAGSRGRTACGVNSFTSSTTVLMADGSVKRIADVRVGDIVLATDPATGETGRHHVTGRVAGHGTKRLVYITIAGHRLTATAGHRVWAVNRRAWIEAEDLQVGDVLRGRDGRTLPVQRLRVVTLAGQTAFNLTVSGVHSYYAGASGVLVHNGMDCGGAAKEGADDLARFRSDLGMPEGEGTLARLDVGGQQFYGVNAHGTNITLRVNPISRTHAEADVMQQAANRGASAREATLHVDRNLCGACGRSGAVRSMARQVGIRRLTVYTPGGKRMITP